MIIIIAKDSDRKELHECGDLLAWWRTRMLEEQLYEIPLDEGYHRDDNIRTYSYQVALVVGTLTLK